MKKKLFSRVISIFFGFYLYIDIPFASSLSVWFFGQFESLKSVLLKSLSLFSLVCITYINGASLPIYELLIGPHMANSLNIEWKRTFFEAGGEQLYLNLIK